MSYWSTYDLDEHILAQLVGKTVGKILWSEDYLVIETDDGTFGFTVEGECCSSSYFHDFFGVEHLLNNGPITEVGDVELDDDDPRFSSPVMSDDEYGESIQVYGYKLVTEHPLFGEVTSVLSFRNSSNGYYGGWMNRTDEIPDTNEFTQLTEDFVG